MTEKTYEYSLVNELHCNANSYSRTRYIVFLAGNHNEVIFLALCAFFFQSLREVFSKPEVKQLRDDSEKIEVATAFDTMWAIMLALRESSIELQTTNTPLKYNVEETYGSDVVTSTIQSKLRNVSFDGLTVIA